MIEKKIFNTLHPFQGGSTMKKSILLLAISILFFGGVIRAQERGFGLGIILGEPTGISAKKWLNSHSAIDGAVAWSFGQVDSFHLHADYIHHDFNMFNVEKGKLPLYFGIGIRFKAEPEATFGVRIPVGICYIFEKAPLDLFLELGPVLDLAPDVRFRFTGSVGARFYFK
jgi:hypothetical protein